MGPVNILHLDEQLGWRGGEQQASWLIRASVEKGHRVWIAGREGSRFLQADHGGADLIRVALPFWAELDVYTCWKLSHLVYEEEVDVIHAHTSHTHTIACIARKLARHPVVVVSRRVSFPPGQDFFNRWKYADPDVYLAVSGEVARVLQVADIDPDKVRRVYSAVDPARLDVEAASRESLGVEADAPLLLSAGALVGHKDHATLLRALPRVREAAPAVRVIIAGEGKLREALEQQIRDLDLQPVVSLLGHREDVPALMQAADCYVSSSWSEGLGTSVLEALACETPVVAAEAGGIPEMVRPGETGHLVPNRDPEALAEAIIDVLQQPDAAAVRAAAGRELVTEAFSVQTMVEDTLATYVETVARVKGFTS